MQRVTGVGGVFFKSPNPKALAEWYRRHLGLSIEDWGGVALRWADDPAAVNGSTVWCPFPADTEYFAPSSAPFMINFRVADLYGLLAALQAEGCKVHGSVSESELGKFGYVIDPDGNKLELWEPPPGP